VPKLFSVVVAMFVVMGASVTAIRSSAEGAKSAATPSEPPLKGQRVFTAGHSFHMFIAPILAEIAQSAGIKDHKVAGTSSIGGSRVIQHWNLEDEKHQAKAALRDGKVDVLTLSPIWLPEDGIEKFARLAYEHNPNVRVTVQEYWLPNDEYVPVYPLQSKKKIDHNAATMAGLREAHDRYFHDMDGLVRDVNKAIGKPVVLVVPVGQAVLALRDKVIKGEAPGIKAQAELFTDSWGHVTEPIQVLDAYCHYAVIYGRSPAGLPMPKKLANAKNPSHADEKLNQLLQELAWDAVVQNPLSGVKPAP
jgi:hypothetical protein